MNLSKIFIDRPIATSMLMVAVVILGIAAYPLLSVASLPNVDFPSVQINASYPGADAQTMATIVAAPLERQFAQIPGLTQLTSTSNAGSTNIVLQFELGRNIDGAAQDVQTAIAAAGGQLPRDMPSPPSYKKTNPSDQSMLAMTVSSKTVPIIQVSDAADVILAQQIAQVDGVGEVKINGERKPAIRIELNPDKLAAKGLSFEDVRIAVAGSTTEQPKGIIYDRHQTFVVDANDQLHKAEEYNDIVIATNNGAPVRLRDVGEAIPGAESSQRAAFFGRDDAVLLFVARVPGADIVATTDRVKKILPTLISELPPGIDVNIIQDRTQTIRASVEEVRFTLLITVILVVMVVFVFLRDVRGTLIPCAVVPVSIVGSFAIMYLMGFSIDNLSLMGLTIAVGFVVDDAIVVVENIERHIHDGMTPYDAAVKGASEIGFTVMSVSISLMAVFIPLLLMGGYIGELFREFALTVCAAVTISLCVSLTLTPMMSARLLGRASTKHGRVYLALERFFDAQLAFYQRTLKVVLRHQRITLAVSGATFVATVVLFLLLPKGFFPEQDNGGINIITVAAPEISFNDMVKKQMQVTDILMADPAIGPIAGFVGGSGLSSGGQFRIGLKPHDERDGVRDVINRLRPKFAQIPGIEVFPSAPQDISLGGRVTRTLYQYTLSDTDQTELNAWAPRILARLKEIPILVDVASDQDRAVPQLSLQINRDSASRLGVKVTDIDATLNDAFGQRQIATVFESTNQYRVVMEADTRAPMSPEVLSRVHVKSNTGGMIPLSSLVTIERTSVPPTVNHQRGFPSVTISFNLVKGAALGDAVNLVNDAISQMSVPGTLHGAFQGNAQAFQSSLASTPYLVAAALLAIYIVLAILYESLIHPLTILSTLPSAGVGALLMLAIFRQGFTVMALIGVILLMGIVKKNGIILVDFALAAERERGMSPEDAIYDACIQRFRPIMMTTMAAMFSGLPLAIGFGTGSELRQPLGLTIVGGLIFSQALTLYTTPVIYLALERLRVRMLARFGSKGALEREHIKKVA